MLGPLTRIDLKSSPSCVARSLSSNELAIGITYTDLDKEATETPILVNVRRHATIRTNHSWRIVIAQEHDLRQCSACVFDETHEIFATMRLM